MFAYNGKNQVETLWERYNQFVTESQVDEDNQNDVDDNNTGKTIREALESHSSLVQLLLKSGADATLKDKEGHVAKDFDFHPDIDGEILDKESRAEEAREKSEHEL